MRCEIAVILTGQAGGALPVYAAAAAAALPVVPMATLLAAGPAESGPDYRIEHNLFRADWPAATVVVTATHAELVDGDRWELWADHAARGGVAVASLAGNPLAAALRTGRFDGPGLKAAADAAHAAAGKIARISADAVTLPDSLPAVPAGFDDLGEFLGTPLPHPTTPPPGRPAIAARLMRPDELPKGLPAGLAAAYRSALREDAGDMPHQADSSPLLVGHPFDPTDLGLREPSIDRARKRMRRLNQLLGD